MRPFACDAVLLNKDMILLIKRGTQPFMGSWALPAGRIEDNETAEQCLIREMKEETGLSVIPLKMVGVYSNPKRDPRGTISAAFIVKRVSGRLKADTDAAEAKWFSLSKLPKLAFDHSLIIRDALELIKEPWPT
jgi:8-oxo-dGTP diphosphatase